MHSEAHLIQNISSILTSASAAHISVFSCIKWSLDPRVPGIRGTRRFMTVVMIDPIGAECSIFNLGGLEGLELERYTTQRTVGTNNRRSSNSKDDNNNNNNYSIDFTTYRSG